MQAALSMLGHAAGRAFASPQTLAGTEKNVLPPHLISFDLILYLANYCLRAEICQVLSIPEVSWEFRSHKSRLLQQAAAWLLRPEGTPGRASVPSWPAPRSGRHCRRVGRRTDGGGRPRGCRLIEGSSFPAYHFVVPAKAGTSPAAVKIPPVSNKASRFNDTP